MALEGVSSWVKLVSACDKLTADNSRKTNWASATIPPQKPLAVNQLAYRLSGEDTEATFSKRM